MENHGGDGARTSVRVLPQHLGAGRESSLQWLIGSPSFPPFTVVSTFRCLHFQPGDPFSPDCDREADDLRISLVRGFEVIGAMFISEAVEDEHALKAAEASRRMRKCLYDSGQNVIVLGAVGNSTTRNIQFFVSTPGKVEVADEVIYEEDPASFLWHNGCLLNCELPIRLPLYIPTREAEIEEIFSSSVAATTSKLRDPQAVYLVEGLNQSSKEACSESHPLVFRSCDLNVQGDLSDIKLAVHVSGEPGSKMIQCSNFCSNNATFPSASGKECPDAIQVSILFNPTTSSSRSAPMAVYLPGPARLIVVTFKLDVLCYASKGLPVVDAISGLVIPGLVDQLTALKKMFLPTLLTAHPMLCPYHFFPPGILHPVTTIYDLSYGETETKRVEIRRSLHLRLGLPLDRPLLRIVNAITFSLNRENSTRTGSLLLKDVHNGIPNSGVSGGFASLVQGSYAYYHYLQHGFDDSGWGCAYRSLQTIISWFILQQYTSIDVPSHREIQQALVELGDKEPSFIGSCEWIGAIELSFVLDKLLGVSCKIINVRSGSELPEKCRELALHFENQGTPVMIGGGVLAYTLLGVDYNEASGDCAFLILDPHYTGTDDHKKIVNGGWCGWKKAVDGKGKHFFLHDKFYNLLLPQRPNIV